MNDELWKNDRNRNKTLLIVEGNHEKDIFMNQLLLSFPEINIDKNNIIVYHTNIYILLAKIKEEYGDDWFEQDINLPWLITKDNLVKEDKKNYTDIYLIFDYERHDPNFSEDGIKKMQQYFSSPEDVGKFCKKYSYSKINEFSKKDI